jgi:hypothetical protein
VTGEVDEAEQMRRTKVFTDELIERLNAEATAGHPANAIFALQYAVAATLKAYGIPVELFFQRVAQTTVGGTS